MGSSAEVVKLPQMVQPHAAPSLSRRGRLLVLGLIASVAMSLGMASGPVSNANAVWTDTFCEVWISPSGSCTMGQGYANHYARFQVYATERAGCVSATGYYGEIVMGWACAPAGGNVATVNPPNKEGWYRGIISNSNASNWARFVGWAACREGECV